MTDPADNGTGPSSGALVLAVFISLLAVLLGMVGTDVNSGVIRFAFGAPELADGIGFVPLTFLLMSSILRSTDASFEEAAMMSGASPLSAFLKVTLRMAAPALLGRAASCAAASLCAIVRRL